MGTIRGVSLVDLEVFNDGRGDLVALEEPTNLPFPLRRVFYMAVGDSRTRRARHAVSADLLLTVVTGSVVVDVDNGSERGAVALETRGRALWVCPGIYITLRDFTPDTVLLVCASEHFKDTRYFQAPQPDLVDALALA